MTHSAFKLTAAAATLLGLSACVGTDNPDFNQQAIDGARVINDLSRQPVTQASNIPTTGSSTYTGIAGFNIDQPGSQGDQFEILADIEVITDFDANDVTGNLSSFNTPDGNGSGTIPLTNGAIVGSAFVMDANGNIGLPDGDSMAIDMDMAGVFRGINADEVSGGGDGTYTLQNDGSSGDLFVQFGTN